MSNEKTLLISMEKLNDLPPLSNAARKILEIIYNPDIDIAVFVEVVEQDPVLLAKLIGLANSAYYGNRKISSAERAIIDILGLRTAKNIALGVVLSGIFDTRQCPGFKVADYWLNSLLSARLAREFARSVVDIEQDEAYLCAMLYEIGQMALAFLYPEEMNQILAKEENSRLSAEVEIFGRNHYAVSAELLNKWHLPKVVVNVLNESATLTGEAAELSKSSNMTRLVCLCKQLSSELLNSQQKSEAEPMQFTELLSSPLADFLQPYTAELESAISRTAGKLDDFKEMAQLLS